MTRQRGARYGEDRIVALYQTSAKTGKMPTGGKMRYSFAECGKFGRRVAGGDRGEQGGIQVFQGGSCVAVGGALRTTRPTIGG